MWRVLHFPFYINDLPDSALGSSENTNTADNKMRNCIVFVQQYFHTWEGIQSDSLCIWFNSNNQCSWSNYGNYPDKLYFYTIRVHSATAVFLILIFLLDCLTGWNVICAPTLSVWSFYCVCFSFILHAFRNVAGESEIEAQNVWILCTNGVTSYQLYSKKNIYITFPTWFLRQFPIILISTKFRSAR